jgi:hypothetical protein
MAEAAIQNGGFEDDFDFWTAKGDTAVQTIATLDDGKGGTVTVNPFAGEKMASVAFPTTTGYVTDNAIYQNVILGPNDKFLIFAYNFWTYDEAPFDSPAFVVSIDTTTLVTLSAADAGGDNQAGTLDITNWQTAVIPVSQFYVPGMGTRPFSVRLTFSAGNTGDASFPSGVFLDNVRLSEVPIPATLWLLGSGLLGLIGLRRRVYQE